MMALLQSRDWKEVEILYLNEKECIYVAESRGKCEDMFYNIGGGHKQQLRIKALNKVRAKVHACKITAFTIGCSVDATWMTSVPTVHPARRGASFDAKGRVPMVLMPRASKYRRTAGCPNAPYSSF